MEALQLTPKVQVSEINERAAFVALEREWDALVASTRDEVFYRHGFFRIWIDNFAPLARLRILIGRDEGGALVAALPLIEERAFLYGVPVRQLVSASNAHSCRFDLIAADPAAAGVAFLDHLIADRSWDLLQLRDVPPDGNAWHLQHAAASAGFPVGAWSSLDSPYIPLPASFEQLQGRLTAKHKANCRRRRRKLEEKGALTFERVEGGDRLDARLEEGFAIEQSGWKGQRGTAIAQARPTRGFYGELARDAAHRGALALYFLRLEGRPIAFHYGLRHAGRYLLLKPGYDEALRECSPGQLLMEDVLRDCIAQQLTEFDFLGPDMVWKRDWTDRSRQHRWLFVFRDTSLGRALCSAKFKWVPAAKGMAKEVASRWRR